jgi:hypothetical protein
VWLKVRARLKTPFVNYQQQRTAFEPSPSFPIVIKVGEEVVRAIGAASAPGSDLKGACTLARLNKIQDQLK